MNPSGNITVCSCERVCDNYDIRWSCPVKKEFAAQNGNRAAEKQFGVNEKLVKDREKAEGCVSGMKKMKKACRVMWNKIGELT